MTILTDIFLIQVILCFIIDLSGIIQSLESGLSKLFRFKCVIPKPFSCALCSGFWINLIYLLCVHQFTLPYICAVAVTAFLSKNISGLLRWFSDMLIKLESLLYKLIR